ncbi:E3 ubiquitin-protein ligase TRIM56-like [Amphiura filiformis]|uniref:E3 ubiquitin-protein ligase TRIM56-like n=1 Tax=Amphiura filiformis TaxID=82378 RepID=UPI003B223BFB
MAKSNSFNSKDLTQCGICLTTQKEPKSLPCLHSYCLECLTQWAKGKTKVSCPICVQDFVIPRGGVKAFRTNFFINTLKDRQAAEMTLQSRDTVVPCASCGAVDERVEGHCSRCGGFICGGCIATHSKIKALSNHKVIPYEDLKSGKVDIRNLSQKKYCKIHEDQVLWFYCETCGVLTCRDCTVVDHPASSHSLVNLESASKGHKKEIEQLIQDCDVANKATVDAVKEIENVTDLLEKDGPSVDAAIDASFNRALKLLEDERKQLKGEVKKAVSDKRKHLDAQKDEVQLQQTRLQTALQMATEVVKTGSDYDLALIYTSLKTNLTELRDVKLAPVDKQKAAVYFKPAHIGQETTQKLGSVVVKQRKEGIGVWKLDRSFGNGGAGKLIGGRGVAITQEEDIVVADCKDAAVKIYKKDGQFKSSIKVPGSPWNVVASSDGKLFVTNLTSSFSVYDGKGNLKHQFPTKSPDNVSSDAQGTQHWGLAIDNYNNLLVGETEQNYISKHHLDGTHIISFKVTIKPYFIAVSSDDKIIILQDVIDAAVHILNDNGVHLQTLKPPQSSGWNPTGICCTSTHEIFISSYGESGTIYSYSAETGAYIGCLTKNVSRCPVGLALMDDEETLVVAGDNDVKIFKLQN